MVVCNIEKRVKHLQEISLTGPSRYLSWAYCYNYFQKFGFNENIDFAALHLGFYLASWGMYRGSSLILNFDYTIYIQLLNELKSKNYNFDPYNLEEIDINLVCDCFETIKIYFETLAKKYPNYDLPNVTHTLITKIMMGIYGIVSPFDRFFIDGLSEYKNRFTTNHFKSLEKKYFRKAYESLISFYCDNKLILEDLKLELSYENCTSLKDLSIPPMRILDMYFWQLGITKPIRLDGKFCKEYNKIKHICIEEDYVS